MRSKSPGSCASGSLQTMGSAVVHKTATCRSKADCTSRDTWCRPDNRDRIAGTFRATPTTRNRCRCTWDSRADARDSPKARAIPLLARYAPDKANAPLRSRLPRRSICALARKCFEGLRIRENSVHSHLYIKSGSLRWAQQPGTTSKVLACSTQGCGASRSATKGRGLCNARSVGPKGST